MDDGEKLGLTVDYRKTVVRFFTETTKALLRSSIISRMDGFSLQWCCPRTEPTSYDGTELPSWVCDWSAIGRHGFEVLPICYHKHGFEAASRRAFYTHEEDHPEMLRRTGCRVALVTEVTEPPQLYQHDERTAYMPESKVQEWLPSIRDFVQLGPESGTGEDYVWRTVQILQTYSPEIRRREALEEVNILFRKTWRGVPILAKSLTPTQIEYVERCFWVGNGDKEENTQEQLDLFAVRLPAQAATASRNRTMFKTNKLMLGLGHVAVQPGDVVTLLWGEKAPFVLRPRAAGGFTFVGDAYVDGIMHGEFLDTEPDEEVFDTY